MVLLLAEAHYEHAMAVAEEGNGLHFEPLHQAGPRRARKWTILYLNVIRDSSTPPAVIFNFWSRNTPVI